MKHIKLFEEFHSVNEAKDVKSEAISRLADFFRIPAASLQKFKFDGSDNVKELTKALNSTSDQGSKLYYDMAIKLAKEELGIDESNIEESHFKVGDKVKMSHGGTGVIVSLDKEDGADDEAYYNIELPNGDVMKHAPNELEKVNEAAMPLNKLVQKFNDEYPKFDPKAKFDYFSARILSGFVYDNWDKITGLRKSTRNDEMMFPSSVDAFVDAVTYEGFYDENYEKFEEVFADMQR